MVSHPELGSDPPIGSDRESGCDKYGSEEPVSVSGCYTSTFGSTGGLEGPECRSRSGTGLTGRDF